MTLDEYQALAMRTATAGGRCVLNAALGMAGEAGEFADEVKKHFFQGHEFDVEKLTKEVGDVLWYVALACDVLGVPMSEVAARNVAKLMARYPDGFATQDSMNRKDG